MRKCEKCGKSIVAKNSHARYCSTRCRVAAHRAAKTQPIPAGLIERDRWVRWVTAIRKGRATKVPLDAHTGSFASSTNSATWASYAEAASSTFGEGVGFVLGEGIGCIDLDHVIIGGDLVQRARQFVSEYPGHYIEISPSGDGLHVWGYQDEQQGTKRDEGGISVERYSTGRYITITGNVFQRGELLPL